MKEISSMDTLSGKEGRAYAKLNGNNEEMFYARSINAKVEKSKGQVKARTSFISLSTSSVMLAVTRPPAPRVPAP